MMQQNTMTRTEIESIFNGVCLAAAHNGGLTKEAESLARCLALALGIDPVLPLPPRIPEVAGQEWCEVGRVGDEPVYAVIDERVLVEGIELGKIT